MIAPAARSVDEDGKFPADGVRALGDAGLLGLASATVVGGPGEGLDSVAALVERLAGVCGSTAMVVLMHYAATAVIEAHGSDEARRGIAAGNHLSTLAFSEVGSRSHFWATQSTAIPASDDTVRLAGSKSWVTSAAQADSFVWSTRPTAGDGPMTLWLVPQGTPGLRQTGGFDGLGLRGNGSTPVTADDVVVPTANRLGDDGSGLDVALATALPWFLVLSGAFCLGLMEVVAAETGRHLTASRLEHLDQALIVQPLVRTDFARLRLATDGVRCLLADTIGALGSGRQDAMLRVLEIKAAAGEAAIAVTDLGMKLCGGAAFRKELAVERHFRDSRAARVMAPTTDALLDFVGRALAGMPLLDG